MLVTSDLAMQFRGVRALSGVNLQVAAGTVHAVVGPRGAGKTTLLNLLSGFLVPTNGTIRYRGLDITGRSPAEVARLGVVRSFRVTDLFGRLPALEHVQLALASPGGAGYRFPPRGERLSRHLPEALQLLDLVGLADRSEVAVASLEPGQRRALEIALALARHPALLLLDEPTAGLEPGAADRLIAVLRRAAGGRTMLVVDHDLHVVDAVADSVTVLRSGQVLATVRASGAGRQAAAHRR